MSDLKPYAVLVVDDEADLRESIVFDLKRKGFNVFEATNIDQALGILQTQTVHVVISDMQMPGGTGIELWQKICESIQNLPVMILITGFLEVSEESLKDQGVYCILPKPFDRKVLMNAVMIAVEKK